MNVQATAPSQRLRPERESNALSTAYAVYFEASVGRFAALPHLGRLLDDTLVFDACARELKMLASLGLLEIVEEFAQFRNGTMLIKRLVFQRIV